MKPAKLTPVLFISLSLVLVLSGCSDEPERDPTIKIHGKITYKGEALKRGTIVFFPEGGKKIATSEIDEDGTYTLTTYQSNDGALPGEHQVTITSERDMTNVLPEDVKPGDKPWLIPRKYNQVKTSGLTATVPDKEKEINFDLK